MFSGGGASWAEAEMKAGRYAVPPAEAGARPDLTGLSCRCNPIVARHGDIVSIIAVPAPGADAAAFRALVAEVVEIAAAEDRGGHPVAADGPEIELTFAGVERESRASAARGNRFRAKLWIAAQVVLLWLLARTGLRLGRFNARAYRHEVADNTDFRKFDDGLKMTVDLDAATAGRIEERLKRAEQAGICRYGMHRQDSALMTCIVASPLQHDHIHFVDGAAGGYAMAAANLKAKAA
jgi:hypothetical protein